MTILVGRCRITLVKEYNLNWYKQAKIVDSGFTSRFMIPSLFMGTILGLMSQLDIDQNEVNALIQHHNGNMQAVQEDLENRIEQKPQSDYSTEPQTQPQHETKELTPAQKTIARIIFSETANTNPEERAAVASVIKNRVNNPAFGGFDDMLGVVTQRNAFEAYGDPKNTNWAKSEHPERMRNPAEIEAWNHSSELAVGNIPNTVGPSGRKIVYYHDKSISKPKSWDNRYYRAIKEVETPKFIFYSVVENK